MAGKFESMNFSGYNSPKAENKTRNEVPEKFAEKKEKILRLLVSLEKAKDTLLKALSLVEYKLKQEAEIKQTKEKKVAEETSSVLGHP